MSKKYQIAVYGSLRLGMYNYDRFKQFFEDGIEFVRTIAVSGFKLYDLGPYPCAVFTERPEDVLVVDILQVSEECKSALDTMEFGAGYKLAQINYDDKKYPIYIYDKAPKEGTIVPEGDWIIHKRKQQK